ncbi:hypothetical protein RCE82_29395, partial [Klebsiella pneumoniae]|nr:hypothetical protein [Klebsiella pneumoniae]MDQ5620463.1 hypothetical protein [Klebsiella pneumoniae]MDQ5626109.1 hypothetical protein [Klebsiella pneumoniae]MDQ5637137.1 hypothetical protein [Klebsiella pneumoniae]MDQ5653721.1 hypothetical protein [Klebsiella pneumoniae]
HQPNRRLRLAAEPQTGRREVSALTDARKTLAYDFFRILRAPLDKSALALASACSYLLKEETPDESIRAEVFSYIPRQKLAEII